MFVWLTFIWQLLEDHIVVGWAVDVKLEENVAEDCFGVIAVV